MARPLCFARRMAVCTSASEVMRSERVAFPPPTFDQHLRLQQMKTGVVKLENGTDRRPLLKEQRGLSAISASRKGEIWPLRSERFSLIAQRGVGTGFASVPAREIWRGARESPLALPKRIIPASRKEIPMPRQKLSLLFLASLFSALVIGAGTAQAYEQYSENGD